MTLAAAGPFGCERELLAAALGLMGHSLAELAASQGRAVPSGVLRDKGFVGRSVERALGLPLGGGADGQRGQAADFGALGVELKTLPVARSGRPRESTFVCYVSLPRVAETAWRDSRVAAKLARVLFVPVESEPRLSWAQRRIGRAFLWSPSSEQLGLLEADYEAVVRRVAQGHLEAIDARLGQVLQLRPKAAHGGVRVRFIDDEDAPVLAQPRAFYLRASFTAGLVREALEAL